MSMRKQIVHEMIEFGAARIHRLCHIMGKCDLVSAMPAMHVRNARLRRNVRRKSGTEIECVGVCSRCCWRVGVEEYKIVVFVERADDKSSIGVISYYGDVNAARSVGCGERTARRIAAIADGEIAFAQAGNVQPIFTAEPCEASGKFGPSPSTKLWGSVVENTISDDDAPFRVRSAPDRRLIALQFAAPPPSVERPSMSSTIFPESCPWKWQPSNVTVAAAPLFSIVPFPTKE